MVHVKLWFDGAESLQLWLLAVKIEVCNLFEIVWTLLVYLLFNLGYVISGSFL